MNKNDLRYIKTEKLIIDTFLECVDSVGFEKTSVSMICEKALISRNTFYIHYEDKYALLNGIYAKLEETAHKKCDEKVMHEIQTNSFAHSVRWMIDFVAENKRAVTVILKSSRKDFYNLIEKIFVDTPMSKLVDNYNEKVNAPAAMLAKSHMVNGAVGFIETWVTSDINMSLSELTRLKTELCVPNTEAWLKQIMK